MVWNPISKYHSYLNIFKSYSPWFRYSRLVKTSVHDYYLFMYSRLHIYILPIYIFKMYKLLCVATRSRLSPSRVPYRTLTIHASLFVGTSSHGPTASVRCRCLYPIPVACFVLTCLRLSLSFPVFKHHSYSAC